jgi:hypothetical protein
MTVSKNRKTTAENVTVEHNIHLGDPVSTKNSLTRASQIQKTA